MKKKIVAKTFWQKLRKPVRGITRPFFVLAPMANVTDAAFRKMIAKYGKPDVMWTEFVSADGLMSSGRERLLIDLKFSSNERPIVAQLFTSNPEAMRGAAKLVAKLGFDGLDINMGCPDRSVERQGGGAAMMKDQRAAIAVLEAAREGVNSVRGRKPVIPVSVKTRLGYNKIDMDWIKLLLQNRFSALTVHLRTRKEMSDAPAHWELMPEIVKMRDELQADLPAGDRTLIIGNGDVFSLDDARERARVSGCDGVMIGRGIFGKPWFFNEGARGKAQGARNVSPSQRLKIMLEHATTFEKMFGGVKNFAVMKKHFKAYVNGWDGAKELRVRLMEAKNFKEVKKILSTTYAF
ncbi:MAG: tRNA-dihydrouridine synthase [Candidatus Taylorbacteria bacterium]